VGLAGTGSNSVALRDVAVPEDRFLSLVSAIRGQTPGAALQGSALYRSAIVPVLTLALTGASLGIAEGAIDAFIDRLEGRVVAYTNNEKQRDIPVTHVQLAMSASKVRAANLLLHHVAEDIERAAHHDVLPDLNTRARMRMDCAFATRLCLEAIEPL